MSDNYEVGLLKPIALDEADQPSSRFQPLTATFVSSAAGIAELEAFVHGLGAEPGIFLPSVFLASVSPQRWRPLLVVVRKGQRIAGVLYCKERVVAGIRTRMAFGYDALGAMVAAHPEETESVISCGVRALLQHMVAVRFLVPSDRLLLLMGIQKNADVSLYRSKNCNGHLELPRTYDEFLVKLGPRTRRNFRYYRRKSELAGNEFGPVPEFSDFVAAARRLLPKAAFPTPQHELDRHLAMIEAMPSRMLIALRRMGGEWIGLAGGWYVGHRAILIMQLNDRTFDRESISLVLRSYLIEALINRGFRELVFWGGSSSPLKFYATYPDVFLMCLDAQSPPWRLGRRAWATVRKAAPGTSSRLLNFLMPLVREDGDV